MVEITEVAAMNALSIKWRGEFLHEIAIMEKSIDSFIADTLCNDRQKVLSMKHIILGDNRISLDAKRSIFKALAEQYHKEWFDSYAGLNNNIKELIEHRNILAHCTLSLDTPKKEGELSFVRYKDSIKMFTYDADLINKLITEIGHITTFIFKKTHIKK